DLAPLAERQVAGHQQAATFVAVAEDAEHQFDSTAAYGHVAQLVDDHQVSTVELAEELVERVLLLLFLELADQLRCREEPYPQARATRRQAKSNRDMSLPRAVTPNQATIELLFDPFTTSQFQH